MCHGFINLILCLEGPRLWLRSPLFGKPVWRLFVSLLDFKRFATLCSYLRRKVGKGAMNVVLKALGIVVVLNSWWYLLSIAAFIANF